MLPPAAEGHTAPDLWQHKEKRVDHHALVRDGLDIGMMAARPASRQAGACAGSVTHHCGKCGREGARQRNVGTAMDYTAASMHTQV